MWTQLDHASHWSWRQDRALRVRVAEVPSDRGPEHILAFGSVSDGCLVRIHSRCLYSESLHFQDCDCGPQLTRSLDLIQQAGSGILIYIDHQEGRGHGLLAKARGYETSERTSLDTYESYESLGYSADDRDYTQAALALAKLGLTNVQLLTNNPTKLAAVKGVGIRAVVVALHTPPRTAREAEYQAVKRRRGHWIPADHPPWAARL